MGENLRRQFAIIYLIIQLSDFSSGNMFVDFGRTPQWNCPLPDDQPSTPTSQSRPTQSQSGPSAPQPTGPSPDAWFIPPIQCHEPEDGVFYIQIGPTGGERGYNAITGS